MVRRTALIAAMLASLLPLTGCWDRIELEQRGFVIGVAIDEGSQPIDPEHGKGKQIFKVTFQEVIPAGLKESSKAESSHEGDTYFNISLEGKSMLSIIAKMSALTSRTPFFEHLKIIVVSEKVARTEFGFANVLDYFLRNNDARRNVAVMISKGEAKKVLDTKAQGEKTPVMFIQSISKNQDTFRMVRETRIGDVHENLMNKESFVIQQVNSLDGHISLIGAAVMNSSRNNMIGWLDELETEGYNFLYQGIQGGVLEVNIGDNLVVYKVERADRKVIVDVSDMERPRFTIELNVEGNLLEAFERLDYLGNATVEDIQHHAIKEIEMLANKTINKTQKELKKDVIGLGSHLAQFYPKVWKQIGDEWDSGRNYYASSDIKVVASVKIRRIGSVNNTERR